jgi:hypothetical protein
MLKPKKISHYSIIGQKGINLIERIVLEMGFVWHPRTIDAGIDGMIELRNTKTEEAYNFHILVQSKATEGSFQNDNGRTFEYTCDERDIDYWLKGNTPVILICSNVVNNEAYWLNIKEYFKDPLIRKTKKAIFNKIENRFTKENNQKLLDLATSTNKGFYFSPAPKVERIVSNLLPLIYYPEYIFCADTKYRRNVELWNALNQLQNKKGINKNWMLSDGKIYSFNDLTKEPWNVFVTKEVSFFNTSIWAKTHELSLTNNFIQLLNNSLETFLHQRNIIHKVVEKNINLFYFRPRLDNDQRPYSKKIYYSRFGRKSHQSVCERYVRKSDPSVISFYRHLALEHKFYRYDGQWYLEITPTYYFTHDGFKMHYYYESKLKGKKALDKATAVFSETIFWAWFLGQESGKLFEYSPTLKFGQLWESDLNAGLDDNLWLKKDEVSAENSFTTQLKIVLK